MQDQEYETPSMYQLCLMHVRADRAMRSLISRELEPYSLTLMEWLALGVVSNAPRDGFSMSQVAELLDVTLPQVTALISSLTKKRLIKQKILSTDRRGRQVVATPRGIRSLVKIEKDVRDIMRKWSRDIPDSQLRSYILTLAHLSAQTEK